MHNNTVYEWILPTFAGPARAKSLHQMEPLLSRQSYDLISCLGNSIVDFPLSEFAGLVKQVTNALKPGGRFVLQYHDGSYAYMTGNILREGI